MGFFVFFGIAHTRDQAEIIRDVKSTLKEDRPGISVGFPSGQTAGLTPHREPLYARWDGARRQPNTGSDSVELTLAISQEGRDTASAQ